MKLLLFYRKLLFKRIFYKKNKNIFETDNYDIYCNKIGTHICKNPKKITSLKCNQGICFLNKDKITQYISKF